MSTMDSGDVLIARALSLWPFYLFSITFWSYLVWNWVRWTKPSDSGTLSVVPRFRKVVTLCGFGLATISVLLNAFLTIHAFLTGGFRYYDPVEMFCIRAGFLTALFGIIAAATGKGSLRIPTAVCAGIALALWVMAGIML
jgi:hypothetical protein